MAKQDAIDPKEDAKSYPYPSEWVSPDVKLTDAYGLAYFKAAHTQWMNQSSYTLRSKFPVILRNRLYADASQSPDIYKSQLLLNKNKSYVNISWEIINIIPKYIDIMMGYFMKFSERISADAVDPEAQDVMREEKAMMEAKVILADELKQMQIMTGQNPQQNSTQFNPQTMEEVALFFQNGYKLAEEIDMEETLTLVAWLNQFDTEVKGDVLRAMIIDGEGGIKRWRDKDGKIKIRNVDIMESMQGFSKRRDRLDCDKFGEYLVVTIGELRKMTDKFTEDDYDSMSWLYSGQLDNMNRSNYYKDYKFGDFPFDQMKVRILDMNYNTTNTYKWEVRNTKFGDRFIKEVPFNYQLKEKGNELKVRNADVWMKGKWLVGSNFIFDYGVVEDQPRNPDNLSEGRSEYHFYRPYKKSMVERMIPHADQIQLAELKLQNGLARARNRGIAIEIGGLEEVDNGKNGFYSTLELRAMYDQQGDLLWRHKDIDDPDASPNPFPIQQLEGGIGNLLQECIALINHHIEMIGTVTGVSQIMDATLPNPRQPVATAEMSAGQTSNILSNIYEGWMTIKENCMQCAGQMIIDGAKRGDIPEGYLEAVGAEKMKYIRANSDLTLYDMGVRIWPNPSESEVNILDALINESVQVRQQTGTGGIELEDAFAVRELMKTSIKAAEQLLVMRRNMRKREDQANAQQQMQIKGQVDQASSQQATQNQLGMLQAEWAMKTKYMQLQEAEKRTTATLTHAHSLEQIGAGAVQKNIQMAHQGQIDTNQARIESELAAENPETAGPTGSNTSQKKAATF